MKGKLIEVVFEERTVEAIIIDPNGLGEGRPTIGMGFGMTERHIGIPQNTLSTWSKESVLDESEGIDQEGVGTHPNLILMSPSKTIYPIHRITDENNREQLVIEASTWMDLAADVLEVPGKLRRATQIKIIHFLKWFAVRGFYSSCYTQLFGAYTAEDDQRITQLQQKVNYLEGLTAELSTELALLEYRYNQSLYRLDSAGLLDDEAVDEPGMYQNDWEFDIEGDDS